MNGFLSYIDYVRDLDAGAFSSTIGTYLPTLPILRDRRIAYAANQVSEDAAFEVLIDLGSELPIDVVGVLGIPRTDAPILGTVEVWLSDSDDHDGNVWQYTINHIYRNVIALSDTTKRARYVRVYYAAGPLAVHRLGKVWVGRVFRLPFDASWSDDPQNNAQNFRSEGRQDYTRVLPVSRVLEWTSRFNTTTAYGQDPNNHSTVKHLRYVAGQGLEVLASPRANDPHLLNETAIYGKLSNGPISHFRGPFFDMTSRIDEGL